MRSGNTQLTRPWKSELFRRLKIATFLVCCTWPAVAAEPLIVGVFPRHSPSQTVQMYHPLAQYLSLRIGREVQIETTASYPLFWQALEAARYHIVHLNQYHYVRAHKEKGYRAIAKNEEAGRATIAGAILVRNDSAIASIQDLKGKTIVFGGDRTALMSYILPTYLLRQAGLQPADYTEIFSNAPPNVALAVYFKQAHAGATGDIVLEMPFVKDKIDVTQMRYLVRGEAVAQLPWAVRSDLSESDVTALRGALLAVKRTENHDKILTSASLTNILPAEDRDYDVIRNIIRSVTNEQF